MAQGHDLAVDDMLLIIMSGNVRKGNVPYAVNHVVTFNLSKGTFKISGLKTNFGIVQMQAMLHKAISAAFIRNGLPVPAQLVLKCACGRNARTICEYCHQPVCDSHMTALAMLDGKHIICTTCRTVQRARINKEV